MNYIELMYQLLTNVKLGIEFEQIKKVKLPIQTNLLEYV